MARRAQGGEVQSSTPTGQCSAQQRLPPAVSVHRSHQSKTSVKSQDTSGTGKDTAQEQLHASEVTVCVEKPIRKSGKAGIWMTSTLLALLFKKPKLDFPNN